MHLAIASERALFAKPEIKLGMPPTFGGTQRLPRLAGRKRALELLLTGDFSPERARDIGLVNVSCRMTNCCLRRATSRRASFRHSPLAVASTITAVTRGLNMAIAEGLLVEASNSPRMAPTMTWAKGSGPGRAAGRPVYTGR